MALELGFFSIPVTNISVAKQFYTKVMGWEFKDRDESFSYIFANDAMVGSMELASENFKPSEQGPLLFFRAEKMSSTLETVASSGGTVRESTAIEGSARGHVARVLDPSMNTIGFWSPEA